MIHAAKLSNSLRPDELLVPRGGDGIEVTVDAQRACWRYLSCRVVGLRDGETLVAGGPDVETVAVIISGGGVMAAWDGGEATHLRGRRSVWDGLPWSLYLPPGGSARLTASTLEPHGRVVVALGHAPPANQPGVSPVPIVIPPDSASVEVRGAGHATRQVTHIVKPDFPADRLLAVEVYTPGGNWSGWPPHKHDVDDFPAEAVLEEIYYYQVRRPEGWALQRLYRTDGTRDAILAVRDGDLMFMPDGYHPFSAPPLYDAYYLNFLAGDRRTMANREDPDLTWVRETFAGTPTDPRVPLVTSADPATEAPPGG